REALNFVCEEILSGRYFDFPPELLRKLAPDFFKFEESFLALLLSSHDYPYLDNVLAVQMEMILGLTAPSRLGRVLGAREKTPAEEDVLTAPDVFDRLHETIFGGLAPKLTGAKATNQKPALTAMQRNLQREYVSHLIFILLRGERFYPAPIQTLARYYVKQLASSIKAALTVGGETDTYTRAHLEECQTRLERALEASYTLDR
ncbi:MAG: zinc-dependent metalloprotease, partial [Planctomycetota bacterium]